MMRIERTGWLLVALGVVACGDPVKSVEKKPTPVKVTLAESDRGPSEARYSGVIEPMSKVEVAFRAGGYVESLARKPGDGGRPLLDVGDRVEKGAVLARIRSADYAQRVASAKARGGEAKASAKLAEQDLERAKKLFEAKVISKAELEAKLAQHDAAIASVAGALAQVGEASLALGDTVLRAPMDGVILARNVEEGTLVAPGVVAFVIADVSSVKVVFGAPEPVVRRLQVGDPLSIRVGEAAAERGATALSAAISRVAPAADKSGRLFTVESILPNPTGSLRSGTVVSVRLPSSIEDRGLVLPIGAIVRSPHSERGFAVFVLEGDEPRAEARLREVAVGDVVGNGVGIERGVRHGERVVTVGASLLSDGADAVVIP